MSDDLTMILHLQCARCLETWSEEIPFFSTRNKSLRLSSIVCVCGSTPRSHKLIGLGKLKQNVPQKETAA